MKHNQHRRVLMALAILLALGLGSCKRRKHYSDPPRVPVFVETESNDSELDANDFGLLAPGDHFIIEGHISDDGFDPFDGFAFTSLVPISVDFDLFIDRGGVDLDLCLFDVESGDEFCFESAENPEYGTIDVFGSDVDFHLVVQSFAGSSTYALEIRVYRLLSSEAEEGTHLAGASLAPEERGKSSPRDPERLEAERRPGSAAGSFSGYARVPSEPAAPERLLGRLITIEIEPETGDMKRQEALILD